MRAPRQWVACGGALLVGAVAVAALRLSRAPTVPLGQPSIPLPSVVASTVAEPMASSAVIEPLPSVGVKAGSYESALSIPPSALPLTESECAAPLGKLAVDCGLEGKAIVKVAVVDGRARGVTMVATKDRPTAVTCVRARVLGARWRATAGLSRCVHSFDLPDEPFTFGPLGEPNPPGEPFDKEAAKAALTGVPYKDCGTGGAGKVTVTFKPTGRVSTALVTAGDYDPATRACIQNRFKGAKVSPFGGAPR